MTNNVFGPLIVLALFIGNSFGQTNQFEEKEKGFNHFLQHNMDYQLRAHFSIGGSAPLGLPDEIRSIKSYDPGLQLGLEANATKWFSKHPDWGIRAGVAVIGRGMKTKARTMNYLTQIIQDQAQVKGYYTGTVQTKVSNTYVNLPISAVYRLSSRWNLYGGLAFSFAIDKEFNGYVSDGVFRQDSPTGPKITFSGDNRAAYDFSDEVQTFQWGTHLGAEWQLNKHFKLFPALNYNFNGVLDKDFNAISFNLYNIYLDIGFAYQF